ncbi:hypothetical protein TNCV_2057021 [Trichonephila clavipes]|nr:hypothetical protein TNCV_2057021 [Trichonephila clavipes]
MTWKTTPCGENGETFTNTEVSCDNGSDESFSKRDTEDIPFYSGGLMAMVTNLWPITGSSPGATEDTMCRGDDLC